MIKGLEELAKACAPEDVTPEQGAAGFELTEEQIDKIAERMISKLQAPAPKTDDPAPEEEDPEEEPEEGEDNGT